MQKLPTAKKPSSISRQGVATSSPDKFMALLSEAIASSPKQPRVMRQLGQGYSGNHSPPSSPGRHSPTMDEIELELDAMRTTLANTAPKIPIASGVSVIPQRPLSPKQLEAQEVKQASESESSDNSSSSDDSSTSDTDSSSDDSDEEGMILQSPHTAYTRRPIMARNRAMGNFNSPNARGLGGISRARIMARYPRLLRKKPIRLPTIVEVPEEAIHEAVSSTPHC